MRRRYLLVAIALAVLAFAAPVRAVTADILGHKERFINHFGDPANGQVRMFAEGQLLDLDEDGDPDALRGKSGLGELSRVLRVGLASTALQRHVGDLQFENVAISSNSVNSSGAQPAIVRQWTPSVGLCQTGDPTRTAVYRVRAVGAIRWSDGWFTGGVVQYSRFFTAPLLNDDPDCAPAPPSADLEVDKTFTDFADPEGEPPPEVGPIAPVDDSFTFTVFVLNNGPDTTDDVVLTDNYPANLDPPTNLPGGCSFNDATRVITCNLGDLPEDDAAIELDFTARTNGSSASAPVVNSATADSDTDDPDPSNNTDAVTVPLTG